jgi:hypothetical protein
MAGISINLGLNAVDPDHYGGWDGKLNACENDARDMERIAKSVGLEDVKVLLTKKATADAVKTEISSAAKKLGEDDFLFLTYSGHGGQVPDTNGDEKEDAKDETWVLYDRQLVDDELYELWSEFQPGTRIFLLSDSCHSGSVARELLYQEALTPAVVERKLIDDPQPRTKALPADVEDRVYRENQKLYDGLQAAHKARDDVEVPASLQLISGCQDNQLSLDGNKNGMFTQKLLETWDDGKFEGTYRAFWKEISKRMPSTQSPNYMRVGTRNQRFERQKPLTIEDEPGAKPYRPYRPYREEETDAAASRVEQLERDNETLRQALAIFARDHDPAATAGARPYRSGPRPTGKPKPYR